MYVEPDKSSRIAPAGDEIGALARDGQRLSVAGVLLVSLRHTASALDPMASNHQESRIAPNFDGNGLQVCTRPRGARVPGVASHLEHNRFR
jgi:hypothetical protein